MLVAPTLSPTGRGAHPPAVRTVGASGGRSGSGGPGLPGGCPAPLVFSHFPVPAARDHCRQARPSPAPPLVWRLGLQRLQVPPAVAPVGEVAAQGPAEPVVGLRVRDGEQRHPLEESPPRRFPVGPPRQNHGPEDPFVVLLRPRPPGGISRFPSSLQRSTASKGRFPNPLVVPEVAQPSHPYSSTTKGRASPPTGSAITSQSRAQSPRAPSAPRAGSACGSCACGAGAAPDPRAAGAEAIRAGSASGSRAAGAGPRGAPLCGWGAGW